MVFAGTNPDGSSPSPRDSILAIARQFSFQQSIRQPRDPARGSTLSFPFCVPFFVWPNSPSFSFFCGPVCCWRRVPSSIHFFSAHFVASVVAAGPSSQPSFQGYWKLKICGVHKYQALKDHTRRWIFEICAFFSLLNY